MNPVIKRYTPRPASKPPTPESGQVLTVGGTEGAVIHPDLIRMGAVREYQPAPPGRLRLFLTGKVGVGKTRFVTSKPRNVVFDFERAASYNPNPQAYVFPCAMGHDKFTEFYEKLVGLGPDKSGVDGVTFDTADAWLDFEEQALCEELTTKDRIVTNIGEYGQKGAGWSRLYKRLRTRLRRLEDAGFGWIVTGHVREQSITRPDGSEVTVVRASVPPGLVSMLFSYADIIGNIARERRSEKRVKMVTLPNGRVVERPDGVVTTEKYVLRTASGIRLETKYRVPKLPSVIELSEFDGYGDFARVYTESAANPSNVAAGPLDDEGAAAVTDEPTTDAEEETTNE